MAALGSKFRFHEGMMNIVILTGAGVSAESGLSTFRDGNGLWEGYRIADVCTAEALDRNPDLVCEFYDSLRVATRNADPNKAHIAIADLEMHWLKTDKGTFLLVTQNVDDLHERAGSSHVIHLHGQLNAASCVECGWHGARHSRLEGDRECAVCGREALRPDVVLFGEAPRQLEKVEQALQTCDLFIAVGTSGEVHPASHFIHRAKDAGAKAILFNKDENISNAWFDFFKFGPCGLTLRNWVDEEIGFKPKGWPISKNQKVQLVDLLRSMGPFHGSFPPSVAERLSKIGLDVTLDANDNLRVGCSLISARSQPMVMRPRLKINGVLVEHEEIPSEGEPAVFGSDLLSAIKNAFELDISSAASGRGFAYDEMVGQLARAWLGK
jgi:NAD-dependent deacetylase